MAKPPRSREASFELALPCAEALPLFTAEGERAWARGWKPVMLSGDRERGSAFRTRSHEGAATYWIVTDYDPGRGKVGYARFAEGSHVGLVDVELTPQAEARCQVRVRYTLTATTAAGADQIGHMVEPRHFDAFIADWKQAIEASLAQ